MAVEGGGYPRGCLGSLSSGTLEQILLPGCDVMLHARQDSMICSQPFFLPESEISQL